MKHAKSLISQADYYPKDGDQLWCVFDCDDNKDSELQAAIFYSEKHGYKIAYSNPAFEYWYLLHFEKRNGYLKDSATVIDILKNKGYLENYGKSVDVFEELQEHQPEAIQYAKERVDNNKPSSGGNDKFEDYTDDVPADEKTIKCSTTDPESGWFRKGEHKHVFAYGIETACDKNGWIIDFTVNPGNEHDSRTFKGLYDKLADIGMKYCIVDAGYKTPAIAKLLLDDGIKPVFPYKRPMTKDGFFRKSEYVYDEYNDAYICPGNHFLHYSTTNRDGYREYKSCGQICEKCEYLSQCTESKNHVKVVTRHVWEDYMETCEDIRHTEGMKELYSHRKETIERIFGTAKENHGFRYTQLYGKARMTMKVALTFACMNLKKLAKCKQEWGLRMA